MRGNKGQDLPGAMALNGLSAINKSKFPNAGQRRPMLPIFLTFGNLISGFISLVSNSLISLSYQQQQQVSTFLKG
jgi:hypothetical protein